MRYEFFHILFHASAVKLSRSSPNGLCMRSCAIYPGPGDAQNSAILQPCLFMSPLLGAKFSGPELLCCSCVSLAGFHGDTHGCSLSAPTQSVVGTAQRNFALWLFAGSASFTQRNLLLALWALTDNQSCVPARQLSLGQRGGAGGRWGLSAERRDAR